jgi:hypothetical protein
MTRTVFCIILLIFFANIVSKAQDSTAKFNQELDRVKVVVLDLSGNATLEPLLGNSINILSILSTKGDVWGIKIPDERPKFQIEYNHSGDTLYVKTPSVFTYNSIGFSTYAEHNINVIQISSAVPIIILNGDHLEIQSGFISVEILDADDISFYAKNKSDIKLLNCKSNKNNLKVNGLKKSSSFEFQGVGKGSYLFNAKNINLTF